MGLLSWFAKRREKKAAIRNAKDLFDEIFMQAAAKSGVAVTWKTALEASTALACARVIAEGLSQVPFRLFQQGQDRRQPASDHPLFDLTDTAPNDYMTSFEFMETLGLHLVFCGNAFVFKNRVAGKVVELLPFEPQAVTVSRTGWNVTYRINGPDNKTFEVSPAEMWHLRGPSWNGWMGLEGVRLAREAIGLSLATEEHGARLFSNGAKVGGVLSSDQQLNEEQRKGLRKSWEEAQAGNANAYKTAVLSNGLKWAPMGTPNDQAQFLETRKFQVEEICRMFRVLPIMVGSYDKAATYASSEQMFMAHVVHTLMPWYRRIEKSAGKALLTEKERAAGYYFKFLANGLMRGAAKDRAEFYAKLYGIGVMNPNEIRDLEDMDPYDGGEKYRVPLNMADPLADPLADPTPADQAQGGPNG